MKARVTIILSGLLLLLVTAGCSHGEGRSSNELLSLAVSGLSGVDRYAFSGDTRIGTGSQTSGTPVVFQGKVENHNQIAIQGIAPNAATTPFAPLDLLGEIEKTAVKTELVPEESNGEQTVLRITADSERTAASWAERLRGELGMLEKKVPAKTVVNLHSAQMRSLAAQTALQEEWQAELARSKKQLESMLAGLRVQSTSKLVIDKNKLLPLSVDQQTTFRYKADGKPMTESRSMRLRFKRLDGSKW
ncbi:hypothetical protein [Paenibacillus sacheonensis]|uniref:Lipoprotein n=1 Tax=Paenibacillus sacheonensis TaxID=742054 RepID=A0A7X5BY37_9BACL|nr:hypothetical protein [Paenibacillus sacheonensis]MBM7563538.1 hypothetical protein [Paenibacillus sacheonensis]NBC71163.1 hypothetical protein [Paenibacillus sacheonensis]